MHDGPGGPAGLGNPRWTMPTQSNPRFYKLGRVVANLFGKFVQETTVVEEYRNILPNVSLACWSEWAEWIHMHARGQAEVDVRICLAESPEELPTPLLEYIWVRHKGCGSIGNTLGLPTNTKASDQRRGIGSADRRFRTRHSDNEDQPDRANTPTHSDVDDCGQQPSGGNAHTSGVGCSGGECLREARDKLGPHPSQRAERPRQGHSNSTKGQQDA